MLKSTLLSGNARLEQASNGPPSIRKRPPDDDADAVRRIQKALAKFGFKLPKSFPSGPNLEPDGLFGPETEKAVRDFQKDAFPKKMSEWDGRCGPNTLGAMDARLDVNKPAKRVFIPPRNTMSVSQCKRGNPASSSNKPLPPGPTPIPYPNVTLKKPAPARTVRPKRRSIKLMPQK